MTTIELKKLKNDYNALKPIIKELKKELKQAPKDSLQEYNIKQALSYAMYELSKIRQKLIDYKFSRFYPTNILDRFIFGDEEEKRIGER